MTECQRDVSLMQENRMSKVTANARVVLNNSLSVCKLISDCRTEVKGQPYYLVHSFEADQYMRLCLANKFSLSDNLVLSRPVVPINYNECHNTIYIYIYTHFEVIHILPARTLYGIVYERKDSPYV